MQGASGGEVAGYQSFGPRPAHLDRLRHEEFDVLVVGGGITGAGVALDAAARGLKVALVEKSDFAGGTSSRSTKLIHGGLRYLPQLRFGLIHEALSERALLQRLAPGLVEPLPFLYPIYGGLLDLTYIDVGLWLYDVLATLRTPRIHRRLGRKGVLSMAPQLRPEGLAGGLVYYDSRTDDVRLTLEVLRTAVGLGAAIVNYVEVVGFLKAGGQVVGVEARDARTGQPLEVRARQVILACGIWMDQLLALDDPAAPKRLRPARGIHLIFPRSRIGADFATVLPTPDGRLMFIIPWQGATLVGTTDTEHTGEYDRPRATAGDVDYLLDAVNRVHSGAALDRGDVVSLQAGLRPLIDTGEGSTASISREDRVFEMPSGLTAIAGGKLTTYRRMARRVVDIAVRRLVARGVAVPSPECRTDRIPLGAFGGPGNLTPWPPLHCGGEGEGVAPEVAAHLRRAYGAGWSVVAAIAAESPRLREPIVPGLPSIWAEVVHAARHEMAGGLADVLCRRTHVALLSPGLGRSAAPETARLMAGELGWAPEEMAARLADYEREIEQFAPV